jgi:hypothetical protein
MYLDLACTDLRNQLGATAFIDLRGDLDDVGEPVLKGKLDLTFGGTCK